MMGLGQDEGGWTLAILVSIEEEAPDCIKEDLLLNIDPRVFEHDFSPSQTDANLCVLQRRFDD